MSKKVLLACFILVISEFGKSEFNDSVKIESDLYSDDEPIILTEYIEIGRINEGRCAASVQPLIENIRSYSGYFQVDDIYDSNLFFWFFPSELRPETAPIIIWLQGGPSASSLLGLFKEIGPFVVDKNGETISKRDVYWSKTMHTVFIDNPVGSGFSFTNHTDGYLSNQLDISNCLYDALQQFFLLFPELNKSDLYVAGQSYAGKYVSSLAYAIHRRNKEYSNRMKFKGIILISPFLDPINQIDYGVYLNSVGLIDKGQKEEFDKIQNVIKCNIKRGHWMDAYRHIVKLIIGKDNLLKDYSGYSNNYNYLIPEKYKYSNIDLYLNKAKVQSRLHVGRRKFRVYDNSSAVVEHLMGDFMQSEAHHLSFIVERYNVLLITGQLDLVCPYPLVENFVKALKWSGAEEFSKSDRYIWTRENKLTGYVTHSRSDKGNGSLTLALLRNAGHFVPMDQPLHTFKLVQDFIKSSVAS